MKETSIFEHAGIRATPSRLRVLEALQTSATPLSAMEVWKKPPADTIGIATIYRTLSALCDAGLIRKILSENIILYEAAQKDNSPQLVCSRCGKVEEVTDPSILRYNTSTLKQRGLAEHDALLLYADCRRKECVKK